MLVMRVDVQNTRCPVPGQLPERQVPTPALTNVFVAVFWAGGGQRAGGPSTEAPCAQSLEQCWHECLLQMCEFEAVGFQLETRRCLGGNQVRNNYIEHMVLLEEFTLHLYLNIVMKETHLCVFDRLLSKGCCVCRLLPEQDQR